MTPRIYLTGSISLENGNRLVSEGEFPGRQGRLAFVFLVANRHRTVSRGELAEVLWPVKAPKDVESALNPILSKLRGVLTNAGLTGDEVTIEARSSTVAARLPTNIWIDIEEAANSIDEAEGAFRRCEITTAWGFANVVVTIARRPFLQDHDAEWIDARRQALRALLIRGLQTLANVSEASGDHTLAMHYIEEVLALEPYRETAYQQLMRQHAKVGNRAEALRVYENCKKLLREELGTSPSPQTESVFLEILRA